MIATPFPHPTAFLVLVTFLVALAAFLGNRRRKILKELKKLARRTVKEVVDKFGHGNKGERWISETAVEFVHLLSGAQNPAHSVIWVRARFERDLASMRIEYLEPLPIRLVPFLDILADEFNNLNMPTEIVRTKTRPTVHELGIMGVTAATATT